MSILSDLAKNKISTILTPILPADKVAVEDVVSAIDEISAIIATEISQHIIDNHVTSQKIYNKSLEPKQYSRFQVPDGIRSDIFSVVSKAIIDSFHRVEEIEQIMLANKYMVPYAKELVFANKSMKSICHELIGSLHRKAIIPSKENVLCYLLRLMALYAPHPTLLIEASNQLADWIQAQVGE